MKSLMPQIDSNDGLFHNGNPATGEQGTRVTDTWLNDVQDRVRDLQAEAHYVLQKAGFTPKAETQTQLYQAIVKIIDDNRKTASLTQKGEVQLSSSTNSNSETKAATSKAVKTAYDKAVDAKTTADGKVGLNGNESINGEKTFENRIVAKRNIRISDNPHYASYGDHLNIGANNGDCWFEYKSSNREIGTLRMHANGDLTYKRNKIYHEGAKPQFNTDIEGKPDTLAGYGIGDFKVEQGQGDANDYKTDGNYYLASGQNLPENGEWHIEVVSGGETNAVRQIARKANDNKIKTRFFNGSNWSEWKDAGGDGVPIGAVVSFPRAVTNPIGFLRADGSTFSQQTFPDLYRTLGDSNQLPDLTRSDVGMTAYFAVDNIPAGWIAFDEIMTQVTEQRYPELYRHLVGKYGSIERVPKVADRFLRNAGNSLSVGQTQEDELKRHTHKVFSSEPSHRSASIEGLKNDNNLLDAGLVTAIGDNEWRDNGWMTPDVNSNFATGGAETRPKSLILKLCIKALNSFDDVVFWIKSHGEVTNAGALDAGRLAQGLQDKADRNHTHTVSQITDFNQSVREIVTQSITQGFTQNLAETGWCKLPNGMILQWGKFNKGHGFVSNEQRLVTFPITFPNKVLFVGLTEFTNVWSYSTTVENRQRMTNSGFYVISQRNDSMYFALGF
ncbi:pyocin knob domain-containing protein [Haemophilus influenzae]|uniref:pyocin knob domain-containing protein n=1 Tax=Haemophilus influenzae TaxID=727 RepID=UPI000CFFDABE|nr:pyocin knob domain-containing protein [Haemophilus influenzae]PRJ17212.1 phage tail fiber repeat protein [Haemophilus influenzae]PRL69681.1 phage tail fiber repeat protein [Haemophilus influenzae]